MELKEDAFRRWGEQRNESWFVRHMHLDVPLVLALFALSITGLAVLYSAGNQDLDIVYRQIVRIGLAFAAMLMIAQIPPDKLKRWSPWLAGLGIILLIAVAIVGDVGKGAQRWLDFGLFRFQPAEIMKLALPMLLAWYLAERKLPPSLKHLAVSAFLIAIPVVLIAKQPDLGTSILIASCGIFVIFLAGISWRLIFFLGAVFASCLPLAWLYMHYYQKTRVLTFLNPESDPLNSGYHIIQSKIAIGSGGFYGKGFLQGTQSHLEFLPERSTDFIFAAFAEELGLVGALLLLALYLFIVIRGLVIATQAQDTYTRLLAGSLTLTFFVYVFVNIGMVSGLLPVVGLPLPLMSYGGTSMVTIMAAFGVLMSIHTHRKMIRN